MLNNVSLMGRLANDPDLRTTSTDRKVLNFTLAVPRMVGSDKDPVTDWIDCTAWGKTAEIIAQYVKKGQRIVVTGSIVTNIAKNEESGTSRKYTTVSVNNVDFVEKKDDSNKSEHTELPVDNSSNNNFTNVDMDDDNLPF